MPRAGGPPVKKAALAAALALFATACVSIDVTDAPPPKAAPAPVALPFDGLAVIPPAPAPTSGVHAADVAISKGPWSAERIAQAAADDAVDPWKAFAGVMGADFNAANYPATKALLDQVMAVAGPAIGQTKAATFRPRPFVAMPNHPTCITPTDYIRTMSAYPSGHATLGWAWGLVLAEIAPAKADALLQRGYDYGQSRIVCGLHWSSDVSASYTLGAAAVARMHGDAGTLALIEAARAEMAAKGK
jgi:acid phosphatase (class A)